MSYSNINDCAGLGELHSIEKSEKRWYIMRDLKRANAVLPAYKQLADLNMEVFTPMTERLIMKKGKTVRKKIPFLPDLLFVHETREKLDPVVQKTPTLQ